MRTRIERDLSAVIRAQIAAHLRRPGMRRFMDGRREEEHDVIDEPRDQLFLIHRSRYRPNRRAAPAYISQLFVRRILNDRRPSAPCQSIEPAEVSGSDVCSRRRTGGPMDIQDGFIVGIFNYCDGWCERCAFTSYCRLFADRAEMEARLDAHHAAIVDAPPLAQEAEPDTPESMRELLEARNTASLQPISPEEWERIQPKLSPEHAPASE